MTSTYKPLTDKEKTHYIKLRDERLEKFSSIDSNLALNIEGFKKNQELFKKNNYSSSDLEKALNNSYSQFSNRTDLMIEKIDLMIDAPKVPNGEATCPDCQMISLYRKGDFSGDIPKANYQCQLCDNKYLGEIKDIKLTKIE
jgi:hypothetical protein